MRARSTSGGERRDGFALIVVLLVLVALLVLCAPFLLSARNADKASSDLADRISAHQTLDAAERNARVQLELSHPALDTTPYWDDERELHVSDSFPEGFLDAANTQGPMWRAEARAVSGLIDLDSAPPQLFANLLGMSTRLTRPIKPDDKELPVSSLQGFEPAGMLWCEGELIQYGKKGEAGFENFVRGVGSAGKQWVGGPKPPVTHGAGAPVIDQRAFAVPLWRAAGPDGSLRELDGMGTLRSCGDFVLARASSADKNQGEALWDGDLIAPLFVHGSVYARARAGQRWMRPVRLTGSVNGGKDGRLRVESARWINPGTTLQIFDGQSTETAIVVEVGKDGIVYLDRILVNDYRAWEAEVRVLARRPVNLNTASREVLQALFTNLQIRDRNARINKDEAETLADVVVESRPLQGWEDFMTRVVLPSCGIAKLPADAPAIPKALAAGQGFLDELDALALYTNGLNANDGALAFSTLPFCFTSDDVYALELRATLNAESGVERLTLVRDEVEVIAPQRRLMQLWATQEDFDEELRLACNAPWWATDPNATSMYDASGSNPPTRLLPNWGLLKGKLYMPATLSTQDSTSEDMARTTQRIFASRKDAGWIQLWPMREWETPRRVGRMLHFDHETIDPEGRFLPDEPVVRAANDKLVGWTDAPRSGSSSSSGPLMLPASGSLWLKPRAPTDSCLLDVAGGSAGSDRLAILFERGDLVLRVWDGTGDHSGTSELEAGEAHYAFTQGQDAPGLPLDVWSHIAFDVRGTRPDQISLLVNGKAHGVRTFGLTRLAGAIDPSSTSIAVESTAGFPARGVARIGDELIEYSLGTGNVLDATPIVAGPYAGFGGRLARERTVIRNGVRVPEILFPPNGGGNAPANVGSHPAGTSVEIFGYSMPLRSNAPSGSSSLPAALGAFAVGIVSRAVTSNASQAGELITMVLPPPLIGTIPLGHGMDGNGSTVTALEIKPADTQTSATQLMSAFSPNGGWALLMQVNFNRLNPQPLPGQPMPSPINEPHTSPPHNARIGGAEFVWYTGVQGNQLVLDMNRRGNATGFRNPGIGREQRAFVVDWDDNLLFSDPTQPNANPPVYLDPDTRLEYEVFVLPISVPAPGASAHFLDPFTSQPPVQNTVNNQTVLTYISEYAQFVEPTRAEMSEWVRYDEINNEQLVRNEDGALRSAFGAVTGRGYDDITDGNAPVPGGGSQGGGGHGTGHGTGGGGGGGGNPPPHPNAMQPPAAPAQTPTTGAYWNEEVGAPESSEGPLTRSARTFLQFRGVMGTFSHPHASGTRLTPVVRIYRRGNGAATPGAEPDAGRPGVDDPVFFVEQDPQLLGNPARVQRAYIPNCYLTYHWRQSGPSQMVPVDAGGSGIKYFVATDNPVDSLCVYVGLRDGLPVPYPADLIAQGTQTTGVLPDIRERNRMTKHPSGERPRAVGQVHVGGALVPTAGGVVPTALVDELCFGGAQFARSVANYAPESLQGGLLWLNAEAGQNASQLYVDPKAVRASTDVQWANYEYPSELPDDAGLLRIGDEILCYSSRTPSSGIIQVATNGRGLLGTRPQPHHSHESVQFLEEWPVSVLAGDLGPMDPALQLTNVTDFPPEGLVLVEDELIHYTHIEGNGLMMPRASSEAGKMDKKGGPLFRGRFGTQPAAHSSGTPVVLFPFRYWDRWAEQADAPELAHFDFAIDQPSAWWESCFFQKTEIEGAKIGVLERDDPDAPWDADPDKDKRLVLHWKGDAEGVPLSIGKQSDNIAWRVFVKYGPDAFDPKASTHHGWRQTPRLDRLGAFYYAPDVVLRSVER